jgi:hypothetical protein
MRLRRSSDDNVSTILSNDGDELTDVIGRDVVGGDNGLKEFLFSRFVVDRDIFRFIEFEFETVFLVDSSKEN